MIKKQTDGTYIVIFSTRNKRGKKIKKQRSGITSLTKARRIENDFIAELKSKQGGFDYAGENFESFLYNHYLPYCEKAYTDAVNLEKSVGKWCQSIFNIKIEAISPNDILQILTDASERLSYNSLLKLRSNLRRIFIHACNGGLSGNPCQDVKIPKQKGATQAKVLNREEVNLLLKKAEELKPEWYLIWAFHLFTGVRSGEGYALLKTDVDLENMMISINKSWNSKVGFKSTKTGDWRLVPISQRLKPIVVQLLNDKRNGEYLLPQKKGSNLCLMFLERRKVKQRFDP